MIPAPCNRRFRYVGACVKWLGAGLAERRLYLSRSAACPAALYRDGRFSWRVTRRSQSAIRAQGDRLLAHEIPCEGSDAHSADELTAVEALAQNQASSSRSPKPLRDGYFLQAFVGGRYG